ncbi:MAG: ABC transporter permease [Pseudomonadota bacterium]
MAGTKAKLTNYKPRAIGVINWVGLATLTRKEIERFTSVYLQTIAAPIVTTLLYYAIFALAFGGVAREVNGISFLAFLAPGLIMMTMVQNAFANTSSSLVISKMQGTVIDILMPPLSSIEILTGYITGGLVRGFAVGLCTAIAVYLFVDFEIAHWWMLLSFAFLGNFMLSALGVLTGIWAEKFDHTATITNFIITPLTFLSGTFYSIESLPANWQVIAHYNPFFYMIDGFRTGFIGAGDGSIMTGLVTLSLINLVLVVLILYLLEIGYKIKS